MKIKLFFFIIITTQICIGQVDLNLGLIAYYPFTGNANDISGNNNNPSFNNATLASDRFGIASSACSFNGTNNYIKIPNSTTLNIATKKISLCAWVKPTGYYTGLCYNNAIIMKQYADYHDGNYNLRFSDAINGCNSSAKTTNEVFYGSVGNTNGTGSTLAATPYVKLNQWYSVVYTNDGINAKIYINCELKATTKITSAFSLTNAEDLFLGHMNNTTFPYWYNGVMDEVRIYNRALSQDEVNIYGDCSTTPVTFANLTTKIVNDKAIKLSWQTLQETNIKDYSIERSTSPNLHFVNIATIVAENITTRNYSFIDNYILPNENYYYRVVITEKDGKKKYSDIKKVTVPKVNSFVTVYPSPSKGNYYISKNPDINIIKIDVINSLGQVVLTKDNLKQTQNNMCLNLTTQAEGSYWLKIYTSNGPIMKRVFKIK